MGMIDVFNGDADGICALHQWRLAWPAQSTLVTGVKRDIIPVAHVEAGLRSGDMTMPEEINRLVTDSISDWFFVTEPSGVSHLRREGKADSAIFYVGHVMVDNALYQAGVEHRSWFDKLTTNGNFELLAMNRIGKV